MSTKPAKKKKAVATPNQDAAKDINAVLKPDPLIDLNQTEEEISPELLELLPSIKEGDTLALTTWKTLKAMGWKEAKAPVKKIAKPAKAADKKKVKVPKEPKEKKPGVLSTILEVLKKGKPITKEGILAVLVKRFPDRAAESMAKTINVQVPNRIAKEHKVKIDKTEKGYVIR